jgi:hypothetical protein
MKKICLLASSLVILSALTLAASDASAQYPWIGIHGSAVFPSGYLKDIADNGYGGGFGIGAYVNPNVVVKAMASYHGFGEKTVWGEKIDGAYIPLEVGANFYLGVPGAIRPYLTTHAGWFVASGDFKDSEFGMGGGLGVEFQMGDPGTKLFVEPNYNIIFQDEDNEEYFGINVGLAFTLSPPSPIAKSQRR